MNRYDELIEILPEKPSFAEYHATGSHNKPVLLSLTREEEETIRHALETMSKLTEARKKATAGEWEFKKLEQECNIDPTYDAQILQDGKYLYSGFDDTQYYPTAPSINDAEFFCIAANLTREE